MWNWQTVGSSATHQILSNVKIWILNNEIFILISSVSGDKIYMRSYIKLMSIISEIIWQEKITIELQQFSKRILEFEINTFQIFILWADSKYMTIQDQNFCIYQIKFNRLWIIKKNYASILGDVTFPNKN